MSTDAVYGTDAHTTIEIQLTNTHKTTGGAKLNSPVLIIFGYRLGLMGSRCVE